MIIANPNLDFKYSHKVNLRNFLIATKELTEALGGVTLSNPEVILWLHEYLSENLAKLYGGVEHENN